MANAAEGWPQSTRLQAIVIVIRYSQSPSSLLFVSFQAPCYCSKIVITPNREYPKHKTAGTIQAISRFKDGSVQSITTLSQDGLIEFSHSLDLAANAPVETSMTPFLDNSHIDSAHKYRVQFQGVHNLTILRASNEGQTMPQLGCHPKYTLMNETGKWLVLSELAHADYSFSDFLEFQSLLLQNKEVKGCFHFNVMKCSRGDVQSRLGNIRILIDPDPIYGTRSILYFRKTHDQKPGFVEWPGKLF